MNQLIHSSHSVAISQMPTFAANLVRARFEGRKLSEIPYQDAIKLIKDLIVNCIRSIGHYNEANDQGVIDFLCKGVLTDVVKHYKNLTDKEFDLILKAGGRGEYKNKPEDLVACNLLSINLWVKKYLESTERKMAMIDYNNRLSLPVAKVEPTPEERENIIKTGCIRAYEAFLHDGSLPVAVVVIYDYLKKANGITWTESEKEAITRQAEKMYKQRQREGGIKVNEGDGLKVEKKRTALHAYFHRCKVKGVKEILTQLKTK